jgi:hypothetical protein
MKLIEMQMDDWSLDAVYYVPMGGVPGEDEGNREKSKQQEGDQGCQRLPSHEARIADRHFSLYNALMINFFCQ